MAAGDTVRVFSFAVDNVFNCSQGIRIYENGVDPPSSEPSMNGADFSNGFTLGGTSQLYNANSTQEYTPIPVIASILIHVAMV